MSKLRVFSVNQCSYGSTGRIMLGIHEELRRKGHESRVAWARGRKEANASEFVFNSKLGVYAHAAMARMTDRTGFFSSRATRELVREIERFDPDIVQLHNIHGYCLDVRTLFRGLRDMDVPVVWTLHSCWPFTGHCTHFEYIGCERWKTGCHDCPQKREFPKSMIADASRRNYAQKKALFTSMKRLLIVTPSAWLANLVKESFLGSYPVEVVRNGIDTSVFNRNVDGGEARTRYGIGERRMLLGVASPWSVRKGLDDIKALRSILPEDYVVVLVGLGEEQKKALPDGIVGIGRTDSIEELASLYASADLFINPTHEDNYPTVNIEALACGTPVVTYGTGGSPECSSKRNECIVTRDRTPQSMLEAIEGYFAGSDQGRVNARIEGQAECAANYLSLYERCLDWR